MTLASLALIFFLIMDPFGNINSFIDQLKGKNRSEYKKVVLREMLFAGAVMLVFALIGEWLLQFLQLGVPTVYISSGAILFLTAFQILFPSSKSLRNNLPKEPPYIIPLAIPLIAGPSLLATIMLFSHEEEFFFVLLAMTIAWCLGLLILVFSHEIRSVLGENGLLAAERLMGMILILLAIQRVAEGVILFIETLPHHG